jgi:hypothetical protein
MNNGTSCPSPAQWLSDASQSFTSTCCQLRRFALLEDNRPFTVFCTQNLPCRLRILLQHKPISTRLSQDTYELRKEAMQLQHRMHMN